MFITNLLDILWSLCVHCSGWLSSKVCCTSLPFWLVDEVSTTWILFLSTESTWLLGVAPIGGTTRTCLDLAISLCNNVERGHLIIGPHSTLLQRLIVKSRHACRTSSGCYLWTLTISHKQPLIKLMFTHTGSHWSGPAHLQKQMRNARVKRSLIKTPRGPMFYM